MPVLRAVAVDTDDADADVTVRLGSGRSRDEPEADRHAGKDRQMLGPQHKSCATHEPSPGNTACRLHRLGRKCLDSLLEAGERR